MDYYTLDRKNVAEMLNISTRTLDRYVAKNFFSTTKKSGKVFFHSREIEDFLQERNTESIDIKSDNQAERLRHIQNQFSSTFSPESATQVVSDSVSKTLGQHTAIYDQETLRELKVELDSYKKFYERGREMHNDLQEKLQNAYQRIGQLEQQVAQTVPLLEVQNARIEDEKTIQHLSSTLKGMEDHYRELEQKSQSHQFFKIFYFSTTVIAILGASFFFALT